MDWSKAKNILIVVFAILNIFLFVMLSRYYFGKNISQDSLSNTVKILKNSGVTLQCTIPEYNGNDIKLAYKTFEYDREKIIQNLIGESSKFINTGEEIRNGLKSLVFKDDQTIIYKNAKPSDRINITDKNEVLGYANRFIEKMGLKVSNYRLDQHEEYNQDGSVGLKYIEWYKGKYLLYDNYIDIKMSKDGILYLECRNKVPLDFTLRDVKVTPAYAILLNNFTNGTKLIITKIDLGFKENVNDSERINAQDGLTWRIKTKGEKVGERYFRALDGREITVNRHE